ncbi:MAG: phosphopentomutase [Dethiobacter sp.]|nr:phosphopentomutase [Dethiobacter sp.]MBS3983395.1 phosphopentomutase [Dethiobacter sp.]
MKISRILIIVLDGLGVGELPDASFYGDAGSNTLANTAKAVGGLSVPLLESFGLGCLTDVLGVPCSTKPIAAYGKMAELSKGKDTTTGHWEMTGIILDKPFPVFADGFPPEVIEPFEAAIGRKVLGNQKASGTEIIQLLGEEHLRTGYPIVYTSADSVFQIAAHEEIIPLELLYEWSAAARSLLREEHAVGRVIARPFTGQPGNFRRTSNRKDYSLLPPRQMLLDSLVANGFPVIGIGKIDDIFAGRGITVSHHSKNNDEGMAKVLAALDQFPQGLIFANLVDFDMLYGHRNDAEGYAHALEQFDLQLKDVLAKLQESDLLFVVSDHGCDPIFPHTDHTREYVPLLVYGPQVRPGSLGIRQTFADLGATVAALFGLPALEVGTKFTAELGLVDG